MSDPRARVVVDPETGNILVVHRRSIGIGTVLFSLAVVSFAVASVIDANDWKNALNSFGSLCCTLIMVLLIWRCCCCCCRPNNRSPGYVIVGNTQLQPNATIQATLTPNTAPGYPVAPAVQPVLTNYPTPGFGTFATPPFVAGAAPQPAYNPNLPPNVQLNLQQAPGPQDASAPPCDAPPSYSEATGIPLKQ